MRQPSTPEMPRTAVRRRTLAVLAVALVTLMACGSGGSGGAEESVSSTGTSAGADRGNVEGSEIVVAQPSDVLTLDPSVDSSPISLNVFKHVFDQLTEIDAGGAVIPLLAESWESNDDATEWTFIIRSDATFHNGEPVTAEDVVWSYEKVLADEESPVNVYLDALDTIEAVDDTTIEFRLSDPFAPWDRQTSLISILPQGAYEEMGPDAFSQEPIGSGAFRLVEWIRDDRLVLETYEGYWGEEPTVDRVVFRPVPSESARVAGLESGELDIVPILPPAEVPRLEETDGIRVERIASNRVLYVGLNVTNPKLDDRNLRQAIDHAIDREAITEDLLGGLGVPEGQVVAPVTFGYDDSIEATPYEPETAQQLLAESDYDGEEILFQYPNNRYAFGVEVAEAVAGYLQEAGINVRLEGMEYSAFFPLWSSNDLQELHLFAYGPSIMDSELPLGSLYLTGSKGYWQSEEIDALIDEQRAQADESDRAETISEIWHASAEYVPYSVLYNEVQAYGIREGVTWSPRPDERLLMHEAEVTG